MQDVSPQSPEARRKHAALHPVRRFQKQVGPGTRARVVVKRVAIGVYNDGFIHAGNLAYLALLSIFPFIIVAAAVARLFAPETGAMPAVSALLRTMPADVADVLRTPIRDVLAARSGNLLWLGAVVGLWTAGSFVETIRDIIRRAYGVTYSRPFWEYRLISVGVILGSAFLALLAFGATVVLSSVQHFLTDLIPGADDLVGVLTLLQVAPALTLFGALYLIFYVLTPARYRKGCPKWPGPLFVTVWWALTTTLLPAALASLGGYDLTYGSLAGVTIALFFFFLIGFGFVIGAALNAALAETPTPSQEEVAAAQLEKAAEEAEAKVEAKIEREDV